jgi:peptidyl-tRNA hydrolase
MFVIKDFLRLPFGAGKFDCKDIVQMYVLCTINLNQANLVLEKLHKFSKQNIFAGTIR